jgi:ferrous iron transport protein A
MMSLDQLDVDVPARVHHVAGERAFRRRLMEIGLVPGTVVERLGPGGRDPLRFRVRDAVVALRRVDARLVQVEAAS